MLEMEVLMMITGLIVAFAAGFITALALVATSLLAYKNVETDSEHAAVQELSREMQKIHPVV
jgi:hypothetical protein